MSEEPRRPRHAAPDEAASAEPPSWTPPPPVRWDTPEPSVSGRLDPAARPADPESPTVINAPAYRPAPATPHPPWAQPGQPTPGVYPPTSGTGNQPYPPAQGTGHQATQGGGNQGAQRGTAQGNQAAQGGYPAGTGNQPAPGTPSQPFPAQGTGHQPAQGGGNQGAQGGAVQGNQVAQGGYPAGTGNQPAAGTPSQPFPAQGTGNQPYPPVQSTGHQPAQGGGNQGAQGAAAQGNQAAQGGYPAGTGNQPVAATPSQPFPAQGTGNQAYPPAQGTGNQPAQGTGNQPGQGGYPPAQGTGSHPAPGGYQQGQAYQQNTQSPNPQSPPSQSGAYPQNPGYLPQSYTGQQRNPGRPGAQGQPPQRPAQAGTRGAEAPQRTGQPGGPASQGSSAESPQSSQFGAAQPSQSAQAGKSSQSGAAQPGQSGAAQPGAVDSDQPGKSSRSGSAESPARRSGSESARSDQARADGLSSTPSEAEPASTGTSTSDSAAKTSAKDSTKESVKDSENTPGNGKTAASSNTDAKNLPGAEDPTRPPGDLSPVVLPQSQQPVAPVDPAAPMPTSVLANPNNPGTQSIMPPSPRVQLKEDLPDPGTDSVVAKAGSEGRESSGRGSEPGSERGSEGTGTGTGTGSGSQGTGSFPGTSRRTGSRTSSRRSRRGRLGAGLIEVPPVPYRDPSTAVLQNPVVSEEKRFCGNCGHKVGRAKDGKAGSPEGTCDNCGTSFSFLPKLQPHELVGGQYEVLGALAYGGLGWIYLAQDHNVSDRWVVLKGLIDTGDATAMAAAANEMRFLAEVEHPNIVKIHNFVQHPDAQTGNSVGYIVMEYVGGQSLRQLALQHHRESKRPEPLPIGQVIAYGLEILPALGYLHGQGLLYCDLKPDNVIQTHEQLKLIDLGAVRRTDDYESPLFFTTGYSAPELATHGASISSDLYTVGRTLAVLSFEFQGYTSKYKTTLPTPDQVPLFALFGSYYRFLRRATHNDPDRRFLAAEDMSDQLTGVLREIMALGTNKPRPAASTVFGPESRTFGVHLVVPEAGTSVPLPEPAEVVAGLPIPQVDTDDPAAGVLATTTALDPNEAIEALAGAPRESIEVRLRIVRARIELGEFVEAQRQLQAAQYLAIRAGFPHDWRIDWYRGLIELAGARPRVAHVAFESVYDDLPGEIAPKLALAVSAEGVGDYFGAARYYELVWRTDRTYVSAAFGLARVYLAQGARASAVEVLEAVPATSTHYIDAQVAAIKIKTHAGNDEQTKVSEQDLVDASGRLERLTLDGERRTRLSAEVLEAAYDWLRADSSEPSKSTKVLGYALEERDVRFGLERCYRSLARLAGTAEDRIGLVDRANSIRPRTLT